MFNDDGPEVPQHLYSAPHWYACRTAPRTEKKAARLLEGAGFECYLPLVEQERQWSDRKKVVAEPLFASYIFSRFPLSELGAVLRQPTINSVARPSGYPTPIRDEVMASVKSMVAGVNETGIAPTAEDYLVTGDAVAVEDGPFQGMKGVLMEERGSSRVVVHIDALRHASGVEVARSSLRRLKTPEH